MGSAKKTIRARVVCQWRQEYFHKWAGAPEDLAYLRSLHRHELHIRVELEVFAFDREIEFVALKDELSLFFRRAIAGTSVLSSNDEDPASPTTWGLVHGRIFNQKASCEEIALLLWEYLKRTYDDHRESLVEVLEDGENGAVVEWTST
jgi:hypothetical protein